MKRKLRLRVELRWRVTWCEEPEWRAAATVRCHTYLTLFPWLTVHVSYDVRYN